MKLPILAMALCASSCTVVAIDSTEHPDGLRMEGLVDGYLAFGMAESHGILEAHLLDGHNDGAIAQIGISNLLGVEVGLLGAALTLGPIHLGLGTLFYGPTPPYIPEKQEPAKHQAEPEHDEGD
ncbi:MAG: hypothetical protein P1V81_13635 [Planctomycetota bacterium]|nr:hypothetical protein [Planctomycetota bacterium]